ncbi:MAG: hypothetical protein NTW87_23405 [Planctomycetota bacterium]|nr:hypothetical protein [Planctomycetota bacterium]
MAGAGAALGLILAVIAVGVLVGLFIGAVILRLACGLVAAPQPTFGRAMVIVFMSWLANVAVSFVVALLAGVSMAAGGAPGTKGVSVVLGALVSAAVYSSMIPTTFGKGLLIWLAQLVIAFVIAVIAVVIILALVGSKSMSAAV